MCACVWVCECVCECHTATEAATQPDCQIANINVSEARSRAQQSMLQGFSFLMLPLGLRFFTPLTPLLPLLPVPRVLSYFFTCLLLFPTFVSFSFFFGFCVILFLFSGFSMRRNHSGVEICKCVCATVCACFYVSICVCVCVCEQMIWKSCIADLVLLLPLLSSQLCFLQVLLGLNPLRRAMDLRLSCSSPSLSPLSTCVAFKDNAYWTF